MLPETHFVVYEQMMQNMWTYLSYIINIIAADGLAT